MLVFASELNCFAAHPLVSLSINVSAIHHYLTYQFIPTPLTIYQEVAKLPPATILACDPDGKTTLTKYWELDYRQKTVLTFSETQEEIRSRLRECTAKRMVSDVPLGAFLSGGVDSSAVVGFMSELSSAPIKTFSIGFEELDFSELEYAKIVAGHFHTDHHEYVVKPQAAQDMASIVWHYGEPFADASALPSYYLSKMAREEVTVALNGDGGDEAFAGYQRHRAMVLAALLDRLLVIFPDGAVKHLFTFVPRWAKAPTILHQARRFLEALLESPARRNVYWHCYFTNQQKVRLYGDVLLPHLAQDAFSWMQKIFDQAPASDLLDRTLHT
ncbi:MAG: asparagine synthetase B family protein, partial [Candidatus Binatia bacterium]